MIIDTHFHAFPGKFLDLIPEARNDVRGVGFTLSIIESILT